MIDISITRTDDLYLELDKYESIKNSIYYTVIKEKSIKQMSEKELGNFKEFILSLTEDEIFLLLSILIDAEYEYRGKNDNDNQKIEDFLSDQKFEQYFDKMLSQLPNY